MVTFVVLTSILLAISLLIIWISTSYNQFQVLIIRINEAEANIDAVLRKRFDLLNKSIDVIKENTKTEEDVLEQIVKLRSRKLSNFELDRKLYDALKEFEKFKEKYPKLKTAESFMKIDIALNESEAEIVAFRKYYNDIITDYNKLVKAFPTNIIALFFKFKSKLYFDGKDMSDEIVDDFKL